MVERNKPSTDIISRIFSSLVIPVVYVGYATYFFEIPNKSAKDYIVGIAVLVIGVFIVANQDLLNKKYVGMLLWFRESDLIYGYIKIKIEYLDLKGDLVAFKREDFISNISIRRKKEIYPIPFETDGEIVKGETSAVNGSFVFPSNKKNEFRCDEKSIVNNGVSFYSCVMSKAFLNSTEYMNFYVRNYCKFYKIEVCIPRPREIVDSRLMRRKRISEKNNDSPDVMSRSYNPNSWQEVAHSRILKINYYEKTSIVAYIDGLDTDEEYRLEWVLNT